MPKDSGSMPEPCEMPDYHGCYLNVQVQLVKDARTHCLTCS